MIPRENLTQAADVDENILSGKGNKETRQTTGGY